MSEMIAYIKFTSDLHKLYPEIKPHVKNEGFFDGKHFYDMIEIILDDTTEATTEDCEKISKQLNDLHYLMTAEMIDDENQPMMKREWTKLGLLPLGIV
ncbi:MAG: hypothetical protein ACMG6E_03085 [Candidatus Roizmanbacteria bacterium]